MKEKTNPRVRLGDHRGKVVSEGELRRESDAEIGKRRNLLERSPVDEDLRRKSRGSSFLKDEKFRFGGGNVCCSHAKSR